MHERCLIAEQAVDALEKENGHLKARLSELGTDGVDHEQVHDAYLEKLKSEVKE